MKMEENVKIIQAYLGGWDETVPTGHLVMGLQFEGDGWGQGDGFYGDNIEERIGKILLTLELSSWDKVVGTPCRIRRDDNQKIIAIGHLIKNRWFTFSTMAMIPVNVGR